MRIWVWLIVACLSMSCLPGESAWAGGRVALIISNDSYATQPRLANPANDAEQVSASLQAIGFTVTRRSNLTKSDMERTFSAFRSQARTADVALVYFAGHGISIEDTNFVIPTDADLVDAENAGFEAIKVSDVLGVVSGAQRLRIVIVDACRNNPFLARMVRGTRSVNIGLRATEAVGLNDTIVAYSAGDGQYAQDGPANGYSPFAMALSRRIREPGVEVGIIFRKIRDDVRKATQNRQDPFVYSSLSAREFYFSPVATTAAAQPPRAMPKTPELLARPDVVGNWVRTSGVVGICPAALKMTEENGNYHQTQPNPFNQSEWIDGTVGLYRPLNGQEVVAKHMGMADWKMTIVDNVLTWRTTLATCVYRRAS